MSDFRVTGLDDFVRAARAVKEAGDKETRRQFFAAAQRATKPLKADVKESARSTLPSHGGLNDVVARQPIGTRTSTTGRNVGVRIVARGKTLRDIAAIDRGRLRHPVFGSRSRWVTQTIPPGWFTRPLERGAPAVRVELLAAMEKVVDDIARKVH